MNKYRNNNSWVGKGSQLGDLITLMPCGGGRETGSQWATLCFARELFYFFPFRFLTRFALSRAIFLSTACGSTFTRFLANWSNARHPLGFFAAMLDRLRVSGVKNVAVAGGRYLIDATHAQAADATPRRLAVQLNEIQLPAPEFKRLDRIYRHKLPAKLALDNFRFHLLNPHKARILDPCEFAVGEALADSQMVSQVYYCHW
jgi:hypothetical protein